MNNYISNPAATLPDDLRQWAREMRHSMTDAEALMWKLLRGRRLADAKFRRQHPLGRYILDFYCHDYKLCIELDGSQHIDQEAYDHARAAWLEEQGIANLRFWNNQVLRETENVMEAIYLALTAKDSDIANAVASNQPSKIAIPLTPDPSPARGRGEQGNPKR